MKSLWTAFMLLVALRPAIGQCPTNEEWQDCGNLCENSCANVCEQSTYQPFADLNSASNTNCVPGCYCKPNYIRNAAGGCVVQTPTVCGAGTNRCTAISANSIYNRCEIGPGEACFQRNIAVKLAGVTGRCVCRPGYKLNLSKKCVLASSSGCVAQQSTQSSILWMPTTVDCT